MFTNRVDNFDHGSVFRRNDGITCQVMCVDDGKYILANLYIFPFEIIREWDAMELEQLEYRMKQSDTFYRYMGRQPYYAEPERD